MNMSHSIPRIFFIFFRVGAFTLGGGIAMISVLRHDLVVSRRWSREEDFAEDFAGATSIPGAWIVNFALIHGYRLRGIWGAAFAFFGVILPSFFIIVVIASFLYPYLSHPHVAAFLHGAAAAVAGILAHTAITMSRSMIKRALYFIPAFCAAAIALVPSINPVFSLIIVSAAVFLFSINSNRLHKKRSEGGEP
jgi:chromate transporter